MRDLKKMIMNIDYLVFKLKDNVRIIADEAGKILILGKIAEIQEEVRDLEIAIDNKRKEEIDKDGIIDLLKVSLKMYINALNAGNLDYNEYKGEVIAYMKILKFEENEYKYLDIDKAKKLLNEI